MHTNGLPSLSCMPAMSLQKWSRYIYPNEGPRFWWKSSHPCTQLFNEIWTLVQLSGIHKRAIEWLFRDFVSDSALGAIKIRLILSFNDSNNQKTLLHRMKSFESSLNMSRHLRLNRQVRPGNSKFSARLVNALRLFLKAIKPHCKVSRCLCWADTTRLFCQR